MKNRRRQFGFSLVEVLMAVGILMVGMLFVAGTFPVGIHLVALSAERTIGAAAADEAFAKIRLYGVNTGNLVSNQCDDFNDTTANIATILPDYSEYLYPSDPNNDNRVYSWSAICRLTNTNEVQATVFVSRKVSNALRYYGQGVNYAPDAVGTSNWPMVNLIAVTGNQNDNFINVGSDIEYFTDDSVIVDDVAGKIYRVIELDYSNDYINLDRKLEDTVNNIWVVPPPVGGGKNPCVGVYQRIIDF